jgi:protein-tyrosine-phosphatase
MPVPLFVCHANCCRSVLAQYLYENLSAASYALSAGIEAGDEINDRAAAMLRGWGIDASGHQPRALTRSLCDRADSIFLMGPDYLRQLLARHGMDLAGKAYLFADPFSLPASFHNGEYLVFDPSFDTRPVAVLMEKFAWFRERVAQIHAALMGKGRPLVPAARYLALLGTRPHQSGEAV